MSLLRDIMASVQPSEAVLVSDGLTPLSLCPIDSRRYAVGFASPDTVPPIISTIPNSALTSGVLLTQQGVLWFTVKDHGSLAMSEWFGLPNGVLYHVTVFTVLVPKG